MTEFQLLTMLKSSIPANVIVTLVPSIPCPSKLITKPPKYELILKPTEPVPVPVPEFTGTGGGGGGGEGGSILHWQGRVSIVVHVPSALLGRVLVWVPVTLAFDGDGIAFLEATITLPREAVDVIAWRLVVSMLLREVDAVLDIVAVLPVAEEEAVSSHPVHSDHSPQFGHAFPPAIETSAQFQNSSANVVPTQSVGFEKNPCPPSP